MKFVSQKLDNGLMIIGELNEFAKSAAVGFFVKTGARDETAQINGVSHFLEHMLFKGTNKLSALEVNEAFDKIGAQFNAFTSEENTVYYAAVLPEYIGDVTQLWSHLMRPALRDDDFNMEKNVIKEEIAMYEDTPSFDVIDRARNLYFGSHPCGNSVLGSRETIDALTSSQMREYFSRRYSPGNLTVAVAGNFDWGKTVKLIAENCSQWQPQNVTRPTPDYPGDVKSGRLEKQNINREHLCLVSPAASMQNERRFAASLLSVIIGDSVGSRYFWALVDKALAETAAMQFESMDGTGAFYSYIRCGSENLTTVLDIIKNLFDELAAQGVTEHELTKARNKVLSSLALRNEIPMGRLLSLGFDWVYLNQYRSIAQDVADVKAVTVDDINAFVKDFPLSRFTKFTLGPASQK
ncbi:MAG: pitrilysin family protein [Phycisphaerae bacterium]|jgi:predicted Zn-dependent peptidase